MKKDVIKGIKGLGDLLHMVAPGLDGLYDVTVRIGGGRLPATLPPNGSIPRAPRPRTDADDTREPVVDVFDEGDALIVIAQLQGVEQHTAQWSFRDSRHLTIRAASADRHYAKELELPAAVDEQTAVSSFVNGVLELKLWKRR